MRFFAPQGGTFHRLSPNLVQQRKTTIPYAMPNFRWIGPYMRISDLKNFKNPKVCKLIHPIGANPSINIHEIHKYYAPVLSTKMFQIWCHLVPNWGSYRQKTAIGQLSPNFWGPGCKIYGSDPKKLEGAKMGRMSSMRVQNLVEIGGHTATGDEKQCCILFVFLYVCHTGCPGKRFGCSTTYNVTVYRAISMWFSPFYRKKRSFQPSAEIFTISLDGTTMFDGIGKNFEKFSKTDGKVCEHDFDHLGAASNKSFIRPL